MRQSHSLQRLAAVVGATTLSLLGVSACTTAPAVDDARAELRHDDAFLDTLGQYQNLIWVTGAAEETGLLVGAREPRPLVQERWVLLDQLQAAADAMWLLRAPEEPPCAQPRLF